jgi:stage II sporulation protein D
MMVDLRSRLRASGVGAVLVALVAVTATPSAAATAGWVLHGAGWGHGIGMSQYGAWEMAKDGQTAKQILAHYYTGTTYDAVADNQVLSVNIAASTSKATLTSSALVSGGGAFRVTVAGSTAVMNGVAGSQVSFSRSGTSVQATCGTCTPVTTLPVTSKATLAWDTLANDKTLMKIGSSSYRDGTMDVTVASSGLNVVNRVRLHDEYLDYLSESPWSWKTASGSLAALQAQAAAARGYALTKYAKGIRSVCNCHVYNTTADQVYGGYPSSGNLPYWPNWKSAVRATGSTTTGYVARYRGTIIEALYSSSSGGRTENNEDVWQTGAPVPYLRGVADSWSLRPGNPNAAWKQTTVGSSMASVFGLPDVVRLDLRDRTANGGVKNATATSSNGTKATITGDRFRSIATTQAAPYNAVKSTMVRHLTGRLAGADRYATAVAVAQRIAPSASSVVIAGGDAALTDASVSGPLAAAVGGPLLLTVRTRLPSATVSELNRRGSVVKTAYVVGGTGMVSDAVVTQLRNRGLTVVRLGGRDRYQTSLLVARQIKAKHAVSAVVVAGGTDLPDALGASGPAAALVEPILLTPVGGMSTYTRQALTATGAKTARILGGTSVVSSTVETQLKSAGVTTLNRLAGADRYGTSAAIAAFYRPKLPSTSEVVLASGDDFAMVNSLVAGTMQRLVVMTRSSRLVEAAAATLQSTPKLETITAAGGTAALASSVLSAAANS